MDVASLPSLTRDTLQVVRDIWVGMMTILEQRGLREPVTQVADLFFWAGGMRQTLQKIAEGRGTEADILALERQLHATEPEVQAIVKALNEGWNKLIHRPDGLSVANEIGSVIHSPSGKIGIREGISSIVQGAPKDQATVQAAQRLCEDTDRFNERVIALHTRVLKPASEIFAARRL